MTIQKLLTIAIALLFAGSVSLADGTKEAKPTTTKEKKACCSTEAKAAVKEEKSHCDADKTAMKEGSKDACCADHAAKTKSSTDKTPQKPTETKPAK